MAAFVARRAFTALKSVSVKYPSNVQIQRRQISFSKILASSRLYTKKHEWLSTEGDIGTVGISDHAQEQLGDIVFVESPEVGTHLQVDDVAGVVESVKAASDIYSPAAGVVTDINEELKDNPALVNEDPLNGGWLYKMKLDTNNDTSGLMDETAYQTYVKQSEE